MKFSTLLLSLLFCGSAFAAHTSDRSIFATDIKNKSGTAMFNFPTALPASGTVLSVNSDQEPVGDSGLTYDHSGHLSVTSSLSLGGGGASVSSDGATGITIDSNFGSSDSFIHLTSFGVPVADFSIAGASFSVLTEFQNDVTVNGNFTSSGGAQFNNGASFVSDISMIAGSSLTGANNVSGSHGQFGDIQDGSNILALDVTNRFLTDVSGTTAVDAAGRDLLSGSSAVVIDWSSGVLINNNSGSNVVLTADDGSGNLILNPAGELKITSASSAPHSLLTLDGSSNVISLAASGNSGKAIISDGTDWAATTLPAAPWTAPFGTGAITGVVSNEIVGYGKTSSASTVQSVQAAAAAFTCSVNPVLTLKDCGTSAGACTAGTTTLASVTITAAGGFAGTISNASIAAGHFWAWEVTAGTCTVLNASGTASMTSP